ncbi:MAG: cytochrome P450 [Propionibacteriaceae bacterium]|nr:cytochrome P450 [Propionibacteriaceae bacterium]
MSKSQVCPHSQRRSDRPGEAAAPPVEVRGGVWHIRSLPTARAILRERGATTQAGFNAEMVHDSPIRMPMLYADGDAHRDQRTKVARYFAPRTVTTRYREFIARKADELVDAMASQGVVDLSEGSMLFSVEVAAQVLGLTNSPSAAMSRRLERMLVLDFEPPGQERTPPNPIVRVLKTARSQVPMWAFYLLDVRPAIKARRAEPQEDVISHLIAEGYSDVEILTESVTFGAAGMITTREFISMATWHLLANPELRQTYLDGEEHQRLGILHEILRLEPVVGHLYRRAVTEITVPGPDGEMLVIPPGTVLDLYIRPVNADIGEDGLAVCPGRDLPKGVGPEVLSFGDGAHRCPGNSLAIHETDILLQRLLRREVTLLSEPVVDWLDLIAGYEVRKVMLKVS